MKIVSDNQVFHNWILRGVAASLLVSLIVFGGSLLASANSEDGTKLDAGQRIVTVFDNGERKTIVTKSNSVGEALAQADIEIDTHDVVEPAIDTKFDTTDYTVNVYRARPVLVEDGMQREWVMSPALSAREIAAEAPLETELRSEDVVKFIDNTETAVDGISAAVAIDRAAEVNIILYGEPAKLYTQAKTIAELLKERGIELAENDTITADLNAPIEEGMAFQIWRDGVQALTEEQDIEFPVRTVQDADKDPSYREVQSVGKPGKRTVTYEVTMRDGQEVSRTEIQSVTTLEPVEEVVVVGAKFKYQGGPLTEEQINALGQCESKMTPTTNTGNGFYGAFQFMSSTWRSVAPAPYNTMLPSEAPLDVQKQAVQNLLSRSSIFTQFPGCANKMRSQGIL